MRSWVSGFKQTTCLLDHVDLVWAAVFKDSLTNRKELQFTCPRVLFSCSSKILPRICKMRHDWQKNSFLFPPIPFSTNTFGPKRNSVRHVGFLPIFHTGNRLALHKFASSLPIFLILENSFHNFALWKFPQKTRVFEVY